MFVVISERCTALETYGEVTVWCQVSATIDGMLQWASNGVRLDGGNPKCIIFHKIGILKVLYHFDQAWMRILRTPNSRATFLNGRQTGMISRLGT